jgi:hypothetical protein
VTAVSEWRRCSACKNPIELGSVYWTCNVSTCNRKRTGLVFCSVTCWEVHLPSANHRESWAVERRAPETLEPEGGDAAGGRRHRVGSDAAAQKGHEVLIVASRLKDYVRETSGFSTSDRVLEPLSEIVRRVCDDAIQNATREGRRTVLDRDVPRS